MILELPDDFSGSSAMILAAERKTKIKPKQKRLEPLSVESRPLGKVPSARAGDSHPSSPHPLF